MGIFYLYRKQDVSGVSGTGFVAEGVKFSNGKVAISWLTKLTSCTIYDDMETVEKIHGHGGATIIAWEKYDYIDKEGRLIVTDFVNCFVADTNEHIGGLQTKEEKRISDFLKEKRDKEFLDTHKL